MSPPIVMSSTFAFESLAEQMAERDRGATSGFYQRLGHPTVQAAERRLADLENAEAALLFPSGMSALSAMFLGHVQTGDHVVALMQCYGGTIDVLNWGRRASRLVVRLRRRAHARDVGGAVPSANARPPHRDADQSDRVRRGHPPRRRARRTAAARCSPSTTRSASPIGQQPLALGADIVAYSATKSIGGHGDLLAGVALGRRACSIRSIARARCSAPPSIRRPRGSSTAA